MAVLKHVHATPKRTDTGADSAVFDPKGEQDARGAHAINLGREFCREQSVGRAAQRPSSAVRGLTQRLVNNTKLPQSTEVENMHGPVSAAAPLLGIVPGEQSPKHLPRLLPLLVRQLGEERLRRHANGLWGGIFPS